VTLEAECRFAASKLGYSYAEFLDLPGDDYWNEGQDSKCKVLVSYRAMTKIEDIGMS